MPIHSPARPVTSAPTTRAATPAPAAHRRERALSAHTVDLASLQRTAGNAAVAGLLRQGEDPLPVQRAWAPAATTDATTLRTGASSGQPKQGGSLPAGTVLVVDRAQQQTQHRTVLKNIVWTRAVNVAPNAWSINQAATVRYVRNAKIGADKVYPDTTNRLAIDRRTGLRTERRWSDQIGEYTWIERSPRGPATEIVRTAGGFRAFTPPATLVATNADENFHVDIDSLETDLKARLGVILTNAENRVGFAAGLLNKPKHVDDLMKPLNFAQALAFASEEFGRWYRWKENVFTTIATGANYMADSIDHWRQTLYPPDPTRVTVSRVDMTASDLHEQGLGVVFVTFQKPPGPFGSPFQNQTNFKAVVKPEERQIEKALFGTQPGSLAGRVNRLAGLGGADTIATIRMETHAQYGSLIQFINGTAAKDYDRQQPPTQAFCEAMALAYIAGLSDVHKENVIYIGGKPHLIDADNALNSARIGMTEKTAPINTQVQSGFSSFSEAGEDAERIHIRGATPQNASSRIMQALANTGHPVPIVDAVRKTFAGKSGRVVPIATNGWAVPLRNLYPRWPLGHQTDAPHMETTKWALCNKRASQVESGRPGEAEGGLVGETGTANAGRVFNQAAEAQQIKNDYDEGKIPFFTYDYNSGHVLHNGQVVWHGQPLAEALEHLLVRFPHQRNIFDIP